jgi:hypothetical protein
LHFYSLRKLPFKGLKSGPKPEKPHSRQLQGHFSGMERCCGTRFSWFYGINQGLKMQFLLWYKAQAAIVF